MKIISLFFLTIVIMMTGCGAPEQFTARGGVDGKDGASCVATQTATGASIVCGDSTATPVTITNGVDGKDGQSIKGDKGDKGDAGQSIVGPKGDKGDKGDAGQSIVGPKGDAGNPGRDGTPGQNGKDGANGKDAAERWSETRPATTAECPYGGTTVDSWLDENANGTYEADVDKNFISVPSCNGRPGDNGKNGDGSSNQDNGLYTLCHIAGKKSFTITVDQSAVAGHLGHGDYMGACQ